MLKSLHLSTMSFVILVIILLFLDVPKVSAEDAGGLINPGTPNNTKSEICDMNTHGQAVGWAYTAAGEIHAFLWDRGVMTDLGTLGGLESRALAINEYGQVVGRAETATGEMHAFLWENGFMEDLGTLGGSRSEALSITENGRVVGRSETAEGELHAFIWENGEMIDLNIPGSQCSETHDVPGTGEKSDISESFSALNGIPPVSAGEERGKASGTAFTKQRGQRLKEKKSSGISRNVGAQEKGILPERGVTKDDIFITPNLGNIYNGLAGYVGGKLPNQSDWIIGNRCPVPLSSPTDAMVFSTDDGTAWEERMRITKAGNIGIGTDNPQYTLHIKGKAISGVNSNASGLYATVSGGLNNTAGSRFSTVGGGTYNDVQAEFSTIAGGGPSDTVNPLNTNNRVTDDYGTIGGGGGNITGNEDADTTNKTYATAGGGKDNTASGDYAAIGGGRENRAVGSGSTVSGGHLNYATGTEATVGGGYNNEASGGQDTVGGGDSNYAMGGQSTVGGGEDNTASGVWATVGGGQNNTAGGNEATVAGGANNTAGGDRSFAAGSGARANHDGTFVWADTSLASFASTAQDQFLVQADGGVGINTDNPGSWDLAVNGSAAKPGGGSWSAFSDIRLKKNVEPLMGALEHLLALRGVTFEYKNPEFKLGLPGRQIGMIAQEVEKVFPEWVDEDEDGYKYVTVRGLEALVVEALRELRQEKDMELEELRAENAELRVENIDMQARLAALEEMMKRLMDE